MLHIKTFENYKDPELEEAHLEVQKWENKLRPLFKELIDSNNIGEIKKSIDIMSDVYISSKQFLFKRLYELENFSSKLEVDNTKDFGNIRSKIKEILPHYIPAYKKYSSLFKK